ncbi:MAG: GGDEF domain-containing protein, partial [Candidatus Limnocylindrales bacterium]
TAEARDEARRFWRQARTDALTRLPNRRFLEEELPLCLAAVSASQPLVVAIVDADHFKRVNDRFSHGVGDRVISELGGVLEEGLPGQVDGALPRRSFVARLGGEEFLVVLPGLDVAAATAVLEAMRDAVARHDWAPLVGALPLTVSIGASRALAHDAPSELMARADHSLYMAKAAGRNRVVADASPSGPRSTASGSRSPQRSARTLSGVRP